MARAAICLLITLSIFACSDSGVQNTPHAHNGRIDFSTWNFETDGIAELSGQWEFYWNRLLTPADFRTGDFPEKIQYITVPMAWGDADVDGERLQAYGFATYRLLVKTKEAAGRKAMRLSKILSAYNLWVDGRLVASSGIVGKSLAAEKPKLSLALPPFQQDRGTLEIVLQVSNHNYRGGGVATPIYFGSADGIRDYQNRRWAWSLIILTGLLTMGGYHFILYLMRRDDGSPLYLGLYCLCWAANNLFSSPSGWLIGHFFPQIPWPVLYRVGISAYFLSLPALMMFLYSLYPRECSVFAVRFYQALGLAFCASAVFLPVRWVVEMVPVYHIFSFALILYSIAFLIKASVRKRNDALVILAGYLVLTLAASNDMLHDSRLISTAYLFHFGLLLFIVFQAFALSLRFSRAFATAEDLSTELQEKNIALARLDRLKDDFLANTTHELRTPLSGIIGIAESMLAGAAGNLPATARNNLAMVVASGRRLAGLVNDLLDFSRLKHKDLTLNKTAVDLRTLADTVTAFLRPLADAKGITLVQAIPHQIPPVQGDEDRLQQIFHNLIGNAIKFTERGSITVSAAAGNPHVEVAITDTGIGIAPDKHETIFLSFEQADATAARKAGGTGLGLAITRHLVELHGGALWVESTPGQGSTFHFTLTAAETEVQPSPPLLNKIIDDLHAYDGPKLFTNVAHGDCGVKQSGYTVLVVDDDPVNLQVAANHLVTDGHRVQTAACGPEAMEIIHSATKPDLVLLDIMMPGMTGYEVCETIRKQHTPAILPVVMLTARNRVSDLVRGFSCGANDYLTKPFSREELLSRVTTQLKLKKAFETLAENVRLKKELTRRQETEHHLLLVQRRLSELLDTVTEALMAVNESEEIAFGNRACLELLGYTPGALLGRQVRTLLDPEAGNSLPAIPESGRSGCGDASVHDVALLRADGTRLPVHAMMTLLDLEDERLGVLVLRGADGGAHAATAPNAGPSAVMLINELNRNQERLRALEETLNAVLPGTADQTPSVRQEIRAIDTALSTVGRSLLLPEKQENKNQLTVSVMNLCIDYWEEATGLQKFDLARQSGLWQVYTNQDGWERTQTLDKYLDLATLPRNPRWRQVLATADFVLTACDSPSGLRGHLESALSELRLACR